MITYRRVELADKYWGVEIMECPIKIMLFAAKLGNSFVTIENFTQYRNGQRVNIAIDDSNGGSIFPLVSRFELDFQLTKEEFLKLEEIWNLQGCYAVFHQLQPIPFKSTSLEGVKRYQALDNFQWNLEIAISDTSSNGWGK